MRRACAACSVLSASVETSSTIFAIGERPPSDTGFGFAEAFRLPRDAEKYPPPTMLPQSEWTVERFRQAKYAIAGTVDQVEREIEQLKTLGGEGDLEWFGWFFDQGFMPWEEEIRQIELFAEHIIPAFR